MTLTVKTNKHWRPFVDRRDVPKQTLNSDFDWTTEDDVDGFFKYRGCWYHISMFMRMKCNESLSEWHGNHGDSYFSGVLIKLSEDGETYQVGTYYS